jgi:hypothetical protein
MKLDQWKESKNKNTTKLSDVNRYLGFAGIGIIWIFKTEVGKQYGIPQDLFTPLFLFVLSLALDFGQYLYLATVWTIFFKYHECQKKKHPDNKKYIDDDIKAPEILPNLSYIIFFFPKVIINVIGYIYLFKYLLPSLMN